MGGLRQANGDDYPEAAGRHLQDANALLAGERHDGAAYLAGYVVECAMKTLIQLETGTLLLVRTISPPCGTPSTCSPRWPTLVSAGCTPACFRWGDPRALFVTSSPDTSRAWLADASKIYDEIVGTLVMDGAV